MLDLLGDWKRTNDCGTLTAADIDREVLLMGWVHRRRDHGQLIFIDLRDRSGIAQVVFHGDRAPQAHAKAESLRGEYVIAVRGRVVRREKPNPQIPTGEIEILATELRLLNTAQPVPFQVEDEVTASEETRLRFRYVDLRRTRLQRNLALRHRIVFEMRRALDELGFYEVETPILARPTPEGARDYLVPSRVHHGQFYALPQSPQLFKQLLMISGLDRYFQIARCFRDEDLRADRQPEFTQLDLEMSFPRQADIFETIERVLARVWDAVGSPISTPFRHMQYRDALERYGSDKPDLRFGMELQNVTPFFEPARETLKLQGTVRAVVAPGAASFSRKQLDELVDLAKSVGAAGVYTVKIAVDGSAASSLEKTLGADSVRSMAQSLGANPGDLIVAVSARGERKDYDPALPIAGQLRLALADRLKLVPAGRWEFAWITGFPLFEWSETEKRWASAQHPFTGIVEEDLDKLESEPWNVRSKGYDLVLNGNELGSGSIRIHQQEVQARLFRMLGLSDEQARHRFGFFLDALTYGTPPHGGIALGIDRMAALIAGEKSIREVIAFPKTTAAQDLMADAPSTVDAPQEDELELMTAYPALPQVCWDLARFCDMLMRLTEVQFFSRQLDARSAYQQSMVLVIRKARNDARAAIRLAKAGYGPQAAGLTRSVVEAAINSEYIRDDPDNRGAAFLKSIHAESAKLAKRLIQHQPTPEVQSAADKALKSQVASGWPMTLAERAYKVSKPHYSYDVVFFLLSQVVHSTVSAAASGIHEGSTGGWSVPIGRGPEWVDTALATVFIFFHVVAHASFSAFGLPKDGLDQLKKQFDAFHEGAARQKGQVS